jgi:hypothetical protein
MAREYRQVVVINLKLMWHCVVGGTVLWAGGSCRNHALIFVVIHSARGRATRLRLLSGSLRHSLVFQLSYDDDLERGSRANPTNDERLVQKDCALKA